MQSEIAHDSQCWSVRLADFEQADFGIDRSGRANHVGVREALPGLHAAVAHDEPPVERNGSLLHGGAGFQNDRLRGGGSLDDGVHRAVDQLVDVGRSQRVFLFATEAEIQLLHVVGSGVRMRGRDHDVRGRDAGLFGGALADLARQVRRDAD